MKTLVADAFAQGGKLLDEGKRGPEAFDLILRILCRGLKASPAAILQTLQNQVVAPGTPFSRLSRRVETVGIQCEVYWTGIPGRRYDAVSNKNNESRGITRAR